MDVKFHMIQNGYTICPDTWGMKDECALFYRIYYVKGGTAFLQKDGITCPLQKEHLYIFPVMEPYTLGHDICDPLEVLWFHVELNWGVQIGFQTMEIQENTALYHLLNAMVALHREPGSFQEILSVFQFFLNRLDERFSFASHPGMRMRRVISYIEEHIQKNPKVTELAACAGMERSYFTRCFKEQFGMSPSHFLYAKKMSVGARALLQGATVAAAAASCGYTDEKAFSRAFHKYMEIPPGEYKKCHIEQP